MTAIIDISAEPGTFYPPPAANSFLLLPFAPKAGGTFFRQAVQRATQDQGAGWTGDAFDFREFRPCRSSLEMWGLKPVIMLRSLPDMLASMWDMLQSAPGDAIWPAQLLEDFLQRDRIAKGDFLIARIAPWYVDYYTDWKVLFDAMPDQVCVLRYRDFCDYPAEVLRAALAHGGFAVSRARCEETLARMWEERSDHRFRKAEQGRGLDYFSPSQLAAIRNLLAASAPLAPWMHDLFSARKAGSPSAMIRDQPAPNMRYA